MFQPAPGPPARPGGRPTALRDRDPLDRLADALEAIAIEALGRQRPRWLERQQAGWVRVVVGDPVAAASRVAIERLEAELAGALEGDIPAFHFRSDDERQRAELGLD